MKLCYHCMSQISNDKASTCPVCGKSLDPEEQKPRFLKPGTVLGGKFIAGYHLGSGGFVKDEDVKVFAGRIYKEAQRLIRLVGDVIRISRLDEGGLPYQWEKLDLYSLTHDIFSTLHEAAEKQEVHMYMEGGSTVLDTVPTIMEEVLYNVCDNAVKYNRRGGEVFVRLKDGEDAVRVNVRDTGIGIPKEDQERIFERFYRVDKSHSKEIGGTGLGLSIVKHGVKTLNGRLWLNSEPGQGTEIIIEFPKHHMEKKAAE